MICLEMMGSKAYRAVSILAVMVETWVLHRRHKGEAEECAIEKPCSVVVEGQFMMVENQWMQGENYELFCPQGSQGSPAV